jgi:hypothetical protein
VLGWARLGDHGAPSSCSFAFAEGYCADVFEVKSIAPTNRTTLGRIRRHAQRGWSRELRELVH